MRKIFWIILLLLICVGLFRLYTSQSKSIIAEDEMVFYSASGAKIASLDPGNIGDTSSAAVASQIFECLYDYHYLKRPYELIPNIAKEMPRVSENGLVYTIKIRENVFFTEDECFGGKKRELTVNDFIFAWKRLANIKYLSRNWWVFDGKIAGLDEFREYTKTVSNEDEVDYCRTVEGLTAIDKYTLQVKLTKPWPQFLYMLAHLPTAAISKEAVDHYGKNIINNPIGTGPFILSKWVKGSYIEMVKNPDYRDVYYPSDGEIGDVNNGMLADAGRKIPFLDRLFFMIIEEDPPAWFLFLQGKLDASGIPKDNFDQAIRPGQRLSQELIEKGIKLQVYRRPSTYWIGFNMEDEILGKNKPLRQAISYCIDKKKYIELFTNNRAEKATGFIPPLMRSFDPNISSFGLNYDIGKGVELIKEAEQIHGGEIPPLKLAMPSTDVISRQQGQFFKKAFKDIGLELEIDYMDWPTYLERLHKKDLQIFQSGWLADYPDAENFLQLFYSKNVSPGPNSFNYVNREFDEIYETAHVLLDADARVELYKRAQEIVIEDCPAVFMLHGVAYILYHDWVENYKPNVFQYGLGKFRRINMEKKSAYQQ